MVIVGDIGGTKTILALYEWIDNAWVLRKKSRYASADYSTFIQLLNVFLEGNTAKITSVCIGIAGPIVNGDCETTNLPWVIRHRDIGRIVNSDQVWLLNDLEATAWGVLGLPDTDFEDLTPHFKEQPQKNKALIAAGTGLGEAVIVAGGPAPCIIGSEGGHADFGPTDEQQIGLLRFLMERYQDHISYERLLSGEGLTNIYDYLKAVNYAPVNQSLEEQMRDKDPAAVIGPAGVAGTDTLSVEALNLFCRIYGAEAGNLALKCLPYSGVYLAGGIAVKILPALKNGEFLKGFYNKGRIKEVLESIPVRVCLNTEAGLIGALRYLEREAVSNN